MKNRSIKLLLVFIIICVAPLFNPINAFPQKTLVESAKKDYLCGDYSDFSDKMKLILNGNAEDPTVRILEGLFFLEENNLDMRLRAGDLIKKNVHYLNNDPFSDFALGILYKKQNNFDHARKYFEKAVEKDDQMVAALIQLGEFHFQQMLKYYNRFTDTHIALSFRDYALEDYDYAISYLRKALRLEPDNRQVAYLLGSLYYEMEEFTLMIQLFTEMSEFYPRDKDLNLFLGLAYLAQHDYENASSFFSRAFDQLTEEEKDEFLNPEYLLKRPKKNLSDSLVADFWDQRDPLFITADNERLLEHFGRFAYANLRFGAPKLGIEGSKTDRGKTYIRYGKPLYIIEYGKSMEITAIYPPMQYWIYPTFQLAFSDEFWNGLFQFTQPGLSQKSVFKERTNVNYSLVAENVFNTIPEKFDFSLPGGLFRAPYQIKFFKGRKNTEGFLAFGLMPEDQLYHPEQDFRAGLFLLGDQKTPVARYEENFHLNFAKSSRQMKRHHRINALVFDHANGHFPYSFEIVNNTLEKNFVDRRELEIPDFSADTLLISDLLLADEIVPGADSSSFYRNGLAILPNIIQTFDQKDTLLVYFEIYNLLPDANGQVNFTVESTLRKKNKGGIFRAIFGKDDERMSIVNEYSGKRQSEYVVQSIQLNNLQAGDYFFEITVRDTRAGQEISKKSDITVIETLNN